MNQGTTLLFIGFKGKQLLTVLLVCILTVIALPVMAVFTMGGPTLSWLASTPDAESAEIRGFYMGGVMEGNTYAWGNCTWWAYAMRLWAGSPIPNTWGNANTWDNYAEQQGYIVNKTPAIGAIFQNDNDGGGYGHVAYVIGVDLVDGRWTISEMNAPTLNVVSTRTFAAESAAHYKFIHSKPGDEAWIPEPLSAMPHLDTGN